jgi:hypothetical protein
MPVEQLRRHLLQLNEEIARLDPADQHRLQSLMELARDIERELEEEKKIGDPAGLVDELETAVSGFEASHPNLTAILNNMLVTLGGMGV